MAIVREELGGGLVMTKSDNGKYICQDGTGKLYEGAIDLESLGTAYTESEESIPTEDEPEPTA